MISPSFSVEVISTPAAWGTSPAAISATLTNFGVSV
jgi:hypothetical protein